jgi:hypothetical protein
VEHKHKHKYVGYKSIENFGAETSWSAATHNIYEGVSKSFRTESITKYTLTKINTRWEATQSVNAAKLTTDSQNSDTTAPSGRELYHLQFSLQAASPETSGYTLVWYNIEMMVGLNDNSG